MSNPKPTENGSFLRTLIFDAAFWALIYFAGNGNQGAENVLTFVVGFVFAVSLLMFFVIAVLDESKHTMEKLSPWRAKYAATTTALECVAMAWFGWPWLAAGYAWATLVAAMYRDFCKPKTEIPHAE